MKKNKERMKGFTLGEMVTTVAIIGTLSAIAIPNYLRIKMNVNMEMVKQHLRTIGTHMNELYNQNKTFPQNILTLLGNSGEEISITSSLNAIDGYNYTRGYQTETNQSNYTLRADPKDGKWGTAGDKCFLTDPSGTREIACWDGTGVAMFVLAGDPNNQVFDALFNQIPPLSQARQVEISAALMESRAYYASWVATNMHPELARNGILPAVGYFANAVNKEKIKALFPEILQILKSKGIDAYFNGEPSPVQRESLIYEVINFAIGFKLKDAVDSQTELDERSIEALNTYETYVKTMQQ